MKLIATYSFHYGRKGPHDDKPLLLQCGEEFEPVATSIASADEAGRFLIRAGQAMTPKNWAKKRLLLEVSGQWADDHVAKLNAARDARKAVA